MNPRLKQLLMRGLAGARPRLEDLSERSWTVAPQEFGVAPRAIFLDGEMERVTATMEETTYPQELARIQGGRREHAATVAYQIAGVHIHNGSLYKGAARHPLTHRSAATLEQGVACSLKTASVAGTFCGSFYFGHWMTDDLTLHLAASAISDAVTVQRRQYAHEPDYLNLLGMHNTFVAKARVEHVVLLQDHGQNRYKRERYDLIRTRFRKAVRGKGNSCVYIRRGNTGASRILLNATEVETFLASSGFTIIDPERLTANEIVANLLEARLVIGVEGSQLTHAIFCMAQGGTLCVLQPPHRFNNWHKDFTDCLEMKYAFTVGDHREDGFIIEVERLSRLLERIDLESSAG